MREILFRGKRIDTGKWVEGCLLVHSEYCAIKPKTSLLCGVIPSTVGQFTGLTDKNGKRIFEGDILQFENDDGEFSLYSCEWGKEICGWIIRFLEYDALCDAFDARFCMDTQVIGNIHDNPELLEVSGNE